MRTGDFVDTRGDSKGGADVDGHGVKKSGGDRRANEETSEFDTF